jgi:hemolysin activation/secretion protein
MLKQALLSAAFLAASQSAHAQQAPRAGAQLRQIPPVQAPAKVEPGLRVEKPKTPETAAVGGATTQVRSLRVTGQTVFGEAALIAASGFKGDSALNLAQLREMAAQISAFYNRHGYFLAQAYLPAQDIENGVVTIAVIEGRYGNVGLQNQTRLKDDVALRVLDGLDAGDLVTNAPLERRLLLLSDIPGVVVNSTLSPGAAVGTSDLAVALTPGPRISGSLEADNAGSRYTGPYRAGGMVNFNNPTGHGDVASLRLLASNSGLAYGRASYQTQLGVGTIGVAYAYLGYDLGRELKRLDADGHAEVASLYGAYPLMRSRDTNLFALADIDLKYFHDEVGLISSTSRRKAQVVTLGLSGDHRDSLGSGGWNVYSLTGSFGNLDIQSPLDRAADALTARSDGGYGKLQFSAARLQAVKGPLSLYGSIRGQIASKNLDSSEKMELGGAYAVRAYPEGEAYGDEGYVATLEARLRLSKIPASLPVQAQLVGFIDAGAVRSAKDPWFQGSNYQHRSGIGAGVNFDLPHDWLLKISYATRLGDKRPTSTPGHARRAWVQITKLF